jgi:hypothetical protein
MGGGRCDANRRANTWWAAAVIERRKPIERTELKRPTIGQVRAWQRKPRKAIAKMGRKAKRERPALDAFREALRSRSRGRCEARNLYLVPSSDGLGWDSIHVPHVARGVHDGCDPHHLFPEDRDRGVHDPARGMWLCRTAHNWTDDHPELAHRAGLLRPEATIEP